MNCILVTMFVAEFCVGHPLSAYTVTKIIASLCCAMMCVKDISAAICKCTPRLCEISIKQKQQNSISHLFLWNGPTAHSSWSHIIGFLMPREAEKALSHFHHHWPHCQQNLPPRVRHCHQGKSPLYDSRLLPQQAPMMFPRGHRSFVLPAYDQF